jgi:hypothetical protein
VVLSDTFDAEADECADPTTPPAAEAWSARGAAAFPNTPRVAPPPLAEPFDPEPPAQPAAAPTSPESTTTAPAVHATRRIALIARLRC